MTRKFSSFPFQSWVFGAWNEASDDIHRLVTTIANARLRHEGELEGNEGVRRARLCDKGALSIITGQVRRNLSLVTARANAQCLLERVQVLGGGERRQLKGEGGWRIKKGG